MQPDELIRLDGAVSVVTFRNEQTGFTVLELETEDDMVTVVGKLPEIFPGEQIRLLGQWRNHPNYGPQFDAQMMESSRPASEAAILKYLSSGAVKGIGKATAKKLVEKFGGETLNIIESEPDRLCEIRGITPAKAAAISEDYGNKFGVREAMVSLAQFGLSPREALDAWKQWGARTVELIRENPYQLCAESIGISFDRADGIAQQMCIEPDSDGRIRAGILYVLRHNLGNGHTCLPREKLVEVAGVRLGVDPVLVDHTLSDMLELLHLRREHFDQTEWIFLPHIHRAESYCAGRLFIMTQFKPDPVPGISQGIDLQESALGITFDALQRRAIELALNEGMLILTGGPGTGKTTTLNAIISLLEQNGEKVQIAAPTGRAAQRITEVTGREAKTIHRLLEVEFSDEHHPVFHRDEKNPLDCDTIIIDELSMVDVLLFESLLRALRLGCRLVLVGDADQLPPVGAGNVLHDLIASKKLPVIALTEVFRQAKSSTIIVNAHRIVRGERPVLDRKDSDFFFLPAFSADQLSDTVAGLCARRLPAAYGLSPFSDIQVLCPGRKGETGCVRLNAVLQGALNPPSPAKAELTIGSTLFRQGDKVMQIKNNYSLAWTKDDGSIGEGVFNGDIGVLEAVDRMTATMVVRFDDRTVLYSSDAAADLELAYAITVHKSQGSEFGAVILPLFAVPPLLSYRNLLYTAVTRAKHLLIVVGQAQTVNEMTDNARKTRRYSALTQFLCREA